MEMSWSVFQGPARAAVCSVLPVEVGMCREVSVASGGLFGASSGGQTGDVVSCSKGASSGGLFGGQFNTPMWPVLSW